MTTVDSIALNPVTRLLTAADLSRLPTDLPSGDVKYELSNGRLGIMNPAGRTHGVMQKRIIGAFLSQAEWQGLGEVFAEVGVILWRNPDSVVGPDVAFFHASALPLKESREGYLETIPDLVAEVRSKNDSVAELEQKTADYLTAGVKLVWIVDPFKQTVTIHAGQSSTEVLVIGSTLTGGTVLPDFRLPLAELFSD